MFAEKLRSEDFPADFRFTRGRTCLGVPFSLVFTDGTAVSFFFTGQDAEIRSLREAEIPFPRRKNNVDERLLFAPLFGRKVSRVEIWNTEENGADLLNTAVYFGEDPHLLVSSGEATVMETAGVPMMIALGEFLKMMPHPEDCFDGETLLRERQTPVALFLKGKLKDDNSVTARLIRVLFEYTRDPRLAEAVLGNLNSEEDRQYLLEMAEDRRGVYSVWDLLEASADLEKVRRRGIW